MHQGIAWVENTMRQGHSLPPGLMSSEKVETARAFHRSFPHYKATPLHSLDNMAAHLGIGALFVKDESLRFGLNAFKALGALFAMARYVAQQTGRRIEDCGYAYLSSPQVQDDLAPITFYTATDGNHGRAVAWAARMIGQHAVVHMPQGSTAARFETIALEGAAVSIEDMNYDGCVRLAAREAEQDPHGVLLQDTAWEGYEDIPRWIMQGYGTLVAEACDQMEARAQSKPPTHVFVQAGVGSLSGALTGYLANRYATCPPRVAILEASAADCLYRSAAAGDGKLRKVDGRLDTIMAGLACGEANTLGWPILRDHAAAFVSCPDWVAAKGMRMLAAPLKGDPQIVSGESGAVGMGVLESIMTDPAYIRLKDALGLGPTSRLLLISTEGDTDPERYRSIVWEGANG